ncbi:TPA: hypothetical protein L3F56_004202 [Klebsiella oxytoca]|nr:hypothetical protein [Klebsiella oxytoca]
MLTFIEELPTTNQIKKGRFLCDCGRETVTRIYYAKTGHTKSCGCLKVKSVTKHGMYKTREYGIWSGMMDRCYQENNPRFADYGARGITVCDQWHDFTSFYKDMGNKPDGMSLDRINNDKGYSPDNCRWATLNEQQWNQRKQKGTTSRFLGVSKSRHGRWVARISAFGVKTHLGYFDTEEEASDAYQKARAERARASDPRYIEMAEQNAKK